MAVGDQPQTESGVPSQPVRHERLVGREIRQVDFTESTMDDVAALARAGTDEGLVLSAQQQTAGRGRHERHWESAPGEDLLVSILFRPRPALAGEINMLLSLAIAETVGSACDVDAVVKWPNDVRVDDAKIAGILLESTQGTDGLIVVAGIGLNVNSRMRHQNPGGTPAVSMRELAARKFDRDLLLDDLLERIDRLYGEVRAGGTLVTIWREKLETIGKQVEVTFTSASSGAKTLSGIAEDVDSAGRLIVRDENGRAWPVSAGEVTLQSSAT